MIAHKCISTIGSLYDVEEPVTIGMTITISARPLQHTIGICLHHPCIARIVAVRSSKAAWTLCLALKQNGLLAKPTHGDKIRLAPPLVITPEQIKEAVTIIDMSLKSLN